MRQSDPQKETVEHEQVKRSKYGEGLQSPDDRIPLIAVREVSLPTTYYDRAVVCPPARNMLDESKVPYSATIISFVDN